MDIRYDGFLCLECEREVLVQQGGPQPSGVRGAPGAGYSGAAGGGGAGGRQAGGAGGGGWTRRRAGGPAYR